MKRPRPIRKPARRRVDAPLPALAAVLGLLVLGAGAYAGREQTAPAVSRAPEPKVRIRIPEEQAARMPSLAAVLACSGVYEHAVIRAAHNGNPGWTPSRALVLNLQPTGDEAAATPGAQKLVEEVERLRRDGATHCGG